MSLSTPRAPLSIDDAARRRPRSRHHARRPRLRRCPGDHVRGSRHTTCGHRPGRGCGRRLVSRHDRARFRSRAGRPKRWPQRRRPQLVPTAASSSMSATSMASTSIVAGRTAWAGSGLTAGAYTTAAAEHGLATGFGDTGSVGLGGITLGGGVGYLVRKHGLTIDNLLAAEIVTADGQVRIVDADNEPDLFWAIRGGGGNFGVATRFRYRLHELDGDASAACWCCRRLRRRSPGSSPPPRRHPRSCRPSPTSCRARRCRSSRRSTTARS